MKGKVYIHRSLKTGEMPCLIRLHREGPGLVRSHRDTRQELGQETLLEFLRKEMSDIG